MTRTAMARLPWLIQLVFWVPKKFLLIAVENKCSGIFFLYYHEMVCWVYSLELPHGGDSNENTQHTIIV